MIMMRWDFTYRSVTSLETVETLLGGAVLLCGYGAFQDRLCDIPELIMLFLHQEDDSCTLAVEGRRDMKESLGDDILDFLIGDGRFFLELIIGTSCLNGLEECFGRHGRG